MIFTEHLSKNFENFLAVEDVSLHVPPGQVLVLLGPNGAGKTTTVRMLSSVLKPSSGQASVAGFDVVKDADKVRARVGVLTEQHGLYGRMNAEEYLEFFGRLYSMPWSAISDRSRRLLDDFGLSEARGKRLSEYSKGMRQKLALARALLHNPPVLLLDEPTSAMDPESARVVRDAIRGQLSAGRAIILCTHNLSEAESLADQVVIIKRGRIIYNGSKDVLIRDLLGPVQFEARFGTPLTDWVPELPAGVQLTGQGLDWVRFQIDDPRLSNSLLLRQMLDRQIDVISFQEVGQNLELAYLEAMSRGIGLEAQHG